MAERAPIIVRTTVVRDEAGKWLVRVRVEQGDHADPLFVGPFKDQADADRNGLKIATLIREAFGIADA